MFAIANRCMTIPLAGVKMMKKWLRSMMNPEWSIQEATPKITDAVKFPDFSGMVCLGPRSLNSRSNEQLLSRKIRLVGGNYAFGHNPKSQGVYLFYLTLWCNVIRGRVSPYRKLQIYPQLMKGEGGYASPDITYVDYLGIAPPGSMCEKIGVPTFECWLNSMANSFTHRVPFRILLRR